MLFVRRDLTYVHHSVQEQKKRKVIILDTYLTPLSCLDDGRLMTFLEALLDPFLLTSKFTARHSLLRSSDVNVCGRNMAHITANPNFARET